MLDDQTAPQDANENENQFDPEKQAEQDYLFDSDPANFKYPTPEAVQDEEDIPEAEDIEVQDDEPNLDEIEPAPVREGDPHDKPVRYDKFKKVYADKKKLEREVDYLKQQNRQIYEQFQQTSAPSDLKEPSITEFTDYDEYEKARDNYNRELGRREAASKSAPNRQEDQFDKYIAQKREKEPGFAQAEQKFLQKVQNHMFNVDRNFKDTGLIPPALFEYVVYSERPIDLAYYFAGNREKAAQLCSLPREQIIRELTRLETRLAPYTSPTRKRTRAPKGIQSKASSPAAKASKPLTKASSFAEYEAIYNKTVRK